MSRTPIRNGFILWFTGPTGSGKSTLAERVGLRLEHRGIPVEVLDEDALRSHLLAGLGTSREAGLESLQRLGWLCGLLTRHGVGVIVAHASHYREGRENLRRNLKNFVEVYMRCPTEICEQRDIQRIFDKARPKSGKGSPGLADPYEPPLNPELTCKTDLETVEESVEKVIHKLEELGCLA